MDSCRVLSVGSHVDVYCPPRKRSRITAPFIFRDESKELENQSSIDVLPDGCLFEIFRRLPRCQERRACACVSKGWLMLQSSIRRSETFINSRPSNPSLKNGSSPISKDEQIVSSVQDEEQECEADGYLTRCLEGYIINGKTESITWASPGLPLLQSSEEPCWLFKDGDGRRHGPHSLAELHFWHRSGYLPDSLMFVEYGNEGSIVLLQACLDQVKFQSEDFQSKPDLLSAIFRYFLSRPNFATVFCEALRSKVMSKGFLEGLSKQLHLSTPEKIVVGLALSDLGNTDFRIRGKLSCLEECITRSMNDMVYLYDMSCVFSIP